MTDGVRIVAAIPAIGLVCGSAAGLFWPETPQTVFFVLLFASTVCALIAYRSARVRVLAVSVAAAFAAGGAAAAEHAWQRAWRPPLRIAFESIARDERVEVQRSTGRVPPEDPVATVNVIGVLRQDASTTANGASLSLRVRWVGRAESGSSRYDAAMNPAEGGVLLTVIGSIAQERVGEWRSGRTIRAPAVLRRPARYLDPGVPDQERALARRGTTLVGTVKSGALVEVTARGSPMAEAAAAVRAFARRAVAACVGRWSGRSAGIVNAIVIGDRTGLDDRVETELQEAGTYHVIAISGGNIAILAGLTLAAFRLAGLLGRTAMLSAIAGLLAYAYLVGGGASVDRATLMAVVYFLGRAIDLRGPPLNSLALVAALLVIGDPLAVADPAFLLTFGATLSILVVAPAALVVAPAAAIRRGPKVLAAAVALLTASIAAEAALMPVAATIFSRVTFAGLVLNFAAIPLMAVAQLAGMAVVPLFIVSAPLARAAGWIAHVGAEGLVRTAGLVAYAPAVTWRVAPPGAVPLAGYYLGLVLAWRFRPLRGPALGVTVAAAIWILAEPWTIVANRGDGRIHITFIDVGQGDAAFVRLPRGGTFVIDAGGLGGSASFDVGDRVAAPVLRAAGVRRLGALMLTHGDADHIGGAPALLAEFRPFTVWEGAPVPPFEPLQQLQAAALAARLPWSNVQTGDAVTIDGVRLEVRHPPPPDWERQDVRNDDSIVIELLWRDLSVVFTGDIGREVERLIAPRFTRSPLRVIKVPHHGSLTSSSVDFLRALAPRVAVISVGRGNNFGHPAPAVLKRYAEVGAQVFRTDQDGAVTLESDGSSLQIRTFTGRRSHLESRPRQHEMHEN